MTPKWKLSGRQIHWIQLGLYMSIQDFFWMITIGFWWGGQTRGNQMALLSTSLSTFTYRFDMLAKINWRRCWLQNHIYFISFPKYQKSCSSQRISQFMLLWTPTLQVKRFRLPHIPIHTKQTRPIFLKNYNKKTLWTPTLQVKPFRPSQTSS